MGCIQMQWKFSNGINNVKSSKLFWCNTVQTALQRAKIKHENHVCHDINDAQRLIVELKYNNNNPKWKPNKTRFVSLFTDVWLSYIADVIITTNPDYFCYNLGKSNFRTVVTVWWPSPLFCLQGQVFYSTL